jgi:hypothetical protein
MLLLPAPKERDKIFTATIMICPVCKEHYPYQGKSRNLKEAIERCYRMMNHHLNNRCEGEMKKSKLIDVSIKTLDVIDDRLSYETHYIWLKK